MTMIAAYTAADQEAERKLAELRALCVEVMTHIDAMPPVPGAVEAISFVGGLAELLTDDALSELAAEAEMQMKPLIAKMMVLNLAWRIRATETKISAIRSAVLDHLRAAFGLFDNPA